MADSKKEPPSSDLSEVERAISVLQGRHPEHERVRRETEEHQAAKAREHDEKIRGAARVRQLRQLKLGAVIIIVLCALAVIAKSVRHESNRQALLDAAAQPFVAKGFVLVDTSARGDPTKLEADVEAGCYVAATARPAAVKLAHVGGSVEGQGSVLTCLCEPGKVTISSTKASEGLLLLRTDAAAIGGSKAFAFLPVTVGATEASDAACADASLDAWLEAKRWPPLTADASWLDAHAPMKAVGFSVAGTIKPSLPFGVVEIPAKTCSVFVDESGAANTSLRLKGGALAIGPAVGSVAWCTSTAAMVVAQRDRKAPMTVLFADADKVGGLLGVRDAATAAGIPIGAMTVPPADRDWIAKELLIASEIPESLITIGVDVVDKEARLVSLSVEKPGVLVSDAPEGVFSFCDPPLEDATASLCIFSGPQTWRITGADSVAGIARAKLPFWLFGLKSVSEPAGLKRETQIVSLARRLKREGYEATTLEAVTETDNGAEVLGRANEDAVVAVTLAPIEPWAIPLGDWTLEGEPHPTPVKPLQRIELTPGAKTRLPPKNTRRTVVFRHHV